MYIGALKELSFFSPGILAQNGAEPGTKYSKAGFYIYQRGYQEELSPKNPDP